MNSNGNTTYQKVKINVIKGIYKENLQIIPSNNGDIFNVFSLNLETRQTCPLLFYSAFVLNILSSSVDKKLPLEIDVKSQQNHNHFTWFLFVG